MNSPADPRTAPVTLTPNGPVSLGVNYPADYVIFRDLAPAEQDGAGSRHWYGRGQNFVVAYSDCAGPVSLMRSAADQPDEWMLLLPDHGTGARIAAAGQVAETPGHSVTLIPPVPAPGCPRTRMPTSSRPRSRSRASTSIIFAGRGPLTGERGGRTSTGSAQALP